MQNVFTLMYMQVLVYLFQILLACREAPLQSLQASGSSWNIVKEEDQTIDWIMVCLSRKRSWGILSQWRHYNNSPHVLRTQDLHFGRSKVQCPSWNHSGQILTFSSSPKKQRLFERYVEQRHLWSFARLASLAVWSSLGLSGVFFFQAVWAVSSFAAPLSLLGPTGWFLLPPVCQCLNLFVIFYVYNTWKSKRTKVCP